MMENQRQYYIDWLRVFAFGLLFVFHSARFFDSYPWHIKNNETSVWVNYFVEFTHNWRMQLIFLISGAGTYFALRSKKIAFVKDRMKRLIIPFVFGVIILIPPQKYLEAISQSSFAGSYGSFLSHYPSALFHENLGVNLIWVGHVGYHIWYLAYLFVQTLLFLPLLMLMMDHKRFTLPIERVTSNFYRVWLLMLPLILFEFALRPIFPRYLDWADFAMYSLFFFYGFIFQLSEHAARMLAQYAYVFLLIGVTCWAYYVFNRPMLDEMSMPEYSWQYLFIVMIRNINTFSWAAAFMGLGRKFLNWNHALLNDLNQGILPFYILHQTVILMVGYYVVQWDLSVLAKFLVIFTTSFTATIGLYQVIRGSHVLRFLFGMKKKVKISFRSQHEQDVVT
jgi:glucans biosynthesis protein C